MRDPEAVTSDAIFNVAIGCGLDIERAEQLAKQHSNGVDMRDWLTPHMRPYIRSLKKRFKEFDKMERSNLRLMTVALIHPNGKQEEICASWDACKKALGNATLTPVWLNDGACLLVDEEGLLKQLEPNYLASQVSSQDIVGSACLVRKHLVNKVLG